MSDFTHESSPFIIKLTVEQCNYMNCLLPKGYSLQAIPQNQTTRKNITPRRINIQSKQILTPQKDVRQNKRNKIASQQIIQPAEKKNILGKREQISKKLSIIKKLKKYQYSWPFRSPVNSKTQVIPNYNTIVLTPMDLHTIEQKIKNDRYEHPSEIERDINQMFLNSYKFNAKDSEYFQATAKLEEYYVTLLQQSEENSKKQFPQKMKKKDENQNHHNNNHENQKSNQMLEFQKDLAHLLKKVNEISGQKQVRQKPVYVSLKNDGPISLKQKRQLLQQIKSLDERHLSRILQIIKHVSKNENEIKMDDKNQTISLDIEKLDNRTIKQLQNYIRLQKNTVLHDREESIAQEQQNNYSVC